MSKFEEIKNSQRLTKKINEKICKKYLESYFPPFCTVDFSFMATLIIEFNCKSMK
jgi:hypothetical protein